MKTRQEGIEANLNSSGEQISKMMTGMPPSPKAKIISKITAAATAKTYDSTKDPIVLATAPTGFVVIPHNNSYTFTHNLGYIPIVQIVCPDTGYIGLSVQYLTDTICTIYNYNYNTSSVHVKIYCH